MFQPGCLLLFGQSSFVAFQASDVLCYQASNTLSVYCPDLHSCVEKALIGSNINACLTLSLNQGLVEEHQPACNTLGLDLPTLA